MSINALKILGEPINAELMDFIYTKLPPHQKFDAKRFYYSLKIVDAIVGEEFGGQNKVYILELGGAGVFTDLLYLLCANIEVHHIAGDYRKAIDTNVKYYLILSMEVIEHFGDLDSSDINIVSTFLHSGLDGHFKNIKNNFHEKTKMFLTTPNVNSYVSVYNLINCRNPYGYKLHMHEYGIIELKDKLKQHFFLEDYCSFDLMDRYGYGFGPDFVNIIDMVASKFSEDGIKDMENTRGTNIIAIVRLAQ